ncbi:hypothetical protein [Rhodococcoides yunnanense]|uniref:hypothetical protein n=1 Tax=Rhodococcoides yunnanense TaxID=278209 RepID=UPI000933686A|nr:hypothetical protein [Rhodococcus yunnanensis]
MASSPDPFGYGNDRGFGSPPPSPRALDSQPTSSLSVAGPPTLYLIASGVLAFIGLIVGAVLGASGPVAVVGWVLAGPVAIGVLSAFTLLDTNRRARPVYTEPTWMKPAYWAVLVIAATGIIVCALRIADWIGRL